MRVLIIAYEFHLAHCIKQHLMDNFTYEVRLAADADEARVAMSDFLPQLLFCETNLRGKDGIRLVSELKRRYAFDVIFILPHSPTKATVLRAAEEQPVNYIFKPISEGALFAAIKLIEPYIGGNKVGRLPPITPSPGDRFSPTEVKVLRAVLERKTTREIAEELYLSPHTVKNHRHNICRKLDLKAENNALLRWALKNKRRIAGHHQLPGASSSGEN